jgi:hypothetical protein
MKKVCIEALGVKDDNQNSNESEDEDDDEI